MALRRSSSRTKYAQGADFERKCKRKLEEHNQCALVIRSAGSKGKVDLAAFWNSGEVWLVQCKIRGVISPEDRHELGQLGSLTGHTVMTAQQKHGRVLFRELEHESGDYVDEGELW